MKKLNLYYVILAVLIAVYVSFVASTPPDSQLLARYNISEGQARVLSLTVIVPLILIWYAAFYGFIKVKQYAAIIKDTRDGRALKIIGDGLMLLAISLPLGAVASNLRGYIVTRNADLTAVTTIAYNYLILALVLAGAWLVAHGARRLVGTLKQRPHHINQAIFASLFTAFCIFYTYITFAQPWSTDPAGVISRSAYHLPDFMIFATIVVPYIVLWYLGFRAAYHIQVYRKNASGVLYNNALGYLASGIAFVVLSLMVLRVIGSLSTQLNSLTLRLLLALLYALVIVVGAGYVLIALGAKKLKKIEEV